MEEYCKTNIAKIKALEEINEEQVKTIKEILECQRETNAKLDAVMPTIEEINDIRSAWRIGGTVGSVLVKTILGIGVVITAIYAIKEWVKKP